MRFLVDQDVYQITIQWLREKDHDLITAKELGLQRAKDAQLLRKANELDRRILTRDKDFGMLVFLKEKLSKGVIRLSIDPTTVETVHKELDKLIKEHDEQELKRHFCVVEPNRHRIRKL